MWRALPPLVLLLAGCGSSADDPATSAPTATSVPSPDLPASYSFDLESSCGERSGLGRFHVTVEQGEVSRVEPVGDSRLSGLGPEDFPTIPDLLDLVASAEEDAVVETTYDDDGIPSLISIDHDPDAIDDEECYRVARFAAIP